MHFLMFLALLRPKGPISYSFLMRTRIQCYFIWIGTRIFLFMHGSRSKAIGLLDPEPKLTKFHCMGSVQATVHASQYHRTTLRRSHCRHQPVCGVAKHHAALLRPQRRPEECPLPGPSWPGVQQALRPDGPAQRCHDYEGPFLPKNDQLLSNVLSSATVL